MLLNIGIIIVSPLNPLFPFFLHHHCLQILYTTNFLRENVFYILYKRIIDPKIRIQIHKTYTGLKKSLVRYLFFDYGSKYCMRIDVIERWHSIGRHITTLSRWRLLWLPWSRTISENPLWP